MPVSAPPDRVVVAPPKGRVVPVVFDSPHSGLTYPPDFNTIAPVQAVRTTCDRFVDELFDRAPAFGAVQVAALFPRSYVDANRAVTDLDPAMIDGAWPGVLVPTEYTSRGMGVIRRYALPGVPLYAAKLTPEQISHRLESYYRPYRAALSEAIESAYASFGRVWHVNCHSMKSTGNKMNVDAGEARPDFVISDRKGRTCEPAFTDWTVAFFSRMGYSVKVNDPYSGGDIVKTYGQPDKGRHSLQIEVNRRLYLDESSYEKAPGFTKLRDDLSAYAEALASYALLKLGASGI